MVNVVLIAAFSALTVASLRFFRVAAVHKSDAVVVVIIVMALWLSPSNSVGLTRPLVDILSSSLLLSLLLTTLLITSANDLGTIRVTERNHWFGYLVVAGVGFFALETFLVVPLFLSLDAVLRRRSREALLHLAHCCCACGAVHGATRSAVIGRPSTFI